MKKKMKIRKNENLEIKKEKKRRIDKNANKD